MGHGWTEYTIEIPRLNQLFLLFHPYRFVLVIKEKKKSWKKLSLIPLVFSTLLIHSKTNKFSKACFTAFLTKHLSKTTEYIFGLEIECARKPIHIDVTMWLSIKKITQFINIFKSSYFRILVYEISNQMKNEEWNVIIDSPCLVCLTL